VRDTNFYGTSLTAIEAARLSRSEIALGFEPERWGRNTSTKPQVGFGGQIVTLAKNHDDCPYVAQATLVAVYVHQSPPLWFQEMMVDKSIPYAERRQRWRSFHACKWRAWDTLDHPDRCYVDSLIWVPEDPLSALEALGTS
jgi:hypothetical protein